MPRPEFVIAGAPKCGTTALFAYLSRHPSVFMPPVKEANYFCTDLRTTGAQRDLSGYEALFATAPRDSISGEASAMYLYSRVAVERLMAYNPAAKVIILLRNPVDAAHSLHAARWAHGHESLENFEDAWRLQAARLSGQHMPPRWPDPATLQYGAIYRYAAQLRRLLRHVPAGQLHIAVYEEFFLDPQRHHAEVLRFLGLAPDSSAEFPVVNATHGFRSRQLDRLLRHPPSWLRLLYLPFRPVFRGLGISPSGRIRWINTVAQRKLPLRPAFRAELAGYFADDIADVEALLDRKLWREVA